MGQGPPPRSTAAGLGAPRLMLDHYPIKLTIQQSLELYGFPNTKPRILTWADVVERGSKITFRACMDAKLDVQKLYNMQRDLQQWIQHDKVTLDDCADLAPWRPNPFLHFRCTVGDLVVRRSVLTHAVLVRGGVTFDALWDRHGLTPGVMALMRYPLEHWVQLGMRDVHVNAVEDAQQWGAVFGALSKKDVLEVVRRG